MRVRVTEAGMFRAVRRASAALLQQQSATTASELASAQRECAELEAAVEQEKAGRRAISEELAEVKQVAADERARRCA